jgi:hypothetical protein
MCISAFYTTRCIRFLRINFTVDLNASTTSFYFSRGMVCCRRLYWDSYFFGLSGRAVFLYLFPRLREFVINVQRCILNFLLLYDFKNQRRIFQILVRVSIIKFHDIPFSVSEFVLYAQTDRCNSSHFSQFAVGNEPVSFIAYFVECFRPLFKAVFGDLPLWTSCR